MRFETTGRSMWPLLRPGDVARIDPLDRPARPGDIVVYVDPVHVDPDGRPVPRLIAHRVIEVLPDGRLRLRGDFTFSAEPPVEQTRIVGRLTSVERAGRIVDLDGPLARLLAFGLPRVERAAPGALAGLRRSVIRGVQVADGLWTAGPVRRVRRVGVRAVVAPTEATALDLQAHLRRSGRDPAAYSPPRTAALLVARLRPPPAPIVGSLRGDLDMDLDAPTWWLRDLYVEHRWRGLGLGNGLLVAGLTAARSAGARQVAVRILETNRRARAFARRFGFKPQASDPTVLVLVLS